jgi:hypothetical protein
VKERHQDRECNTNEEYGRIVKKRHNNNMKKNHGCSIEQRHNNGAKEKYGHIVKEGQ